MALHLIRATDGSTPFWGIQSDEQIRKLATPCTTTGDLLALGYREIDRLIASAAESVPTSAVSLLSPITDNAKVLCQGANYRQHMIESGMDPDAKKFNMFFTKSSASIHSPVGDITKPSHVRLLDYEIELVLVLGKRTRGEQRITDANLHDYVAGICIGNDVSARDVQLPQMQFHKGKSYRTFCPLGPVLCLLTAEEMVSLNSLELVLKVNGEVRQQDNTANLVFKPAESLAEFSQIHDFEPGDVVMTGTPAGCALGIPSPAVVRIAALLPEVKKWQLFMKGQSKRSQYLKAGDKVESTIRCISGRIDLGRQQHTVVEQGR